MALEWMPRDDELKDHMLHTDVHWGKDVSCITLYRLPIGNGRVLRRTQCRENVGPETWGAQGSEDSRVESESGSWSSRGWTESDAV